VSAPAVQASAPAAAAPAQVQRPPSLGGRDEYVSVIYDLQPIPNQPQGLLVLIGLQNTSAVPLGGFQFQLGSSAAAKVVDQAPVSPSFVLKPGTSCSTKAIFQIQSAAFPVGVQCALGYTNAQGQRRQLPFQLRFNASAFLAPIETTLDSIQSLIATSDPKFSISSIKIPPKFLSADLNRFVLQLVTIFRLYNVGGARDTAVLYGKSRLTGAHVCLYVHWTRQNVDVHSSDPRFGEAIAAEISSQN